MIHGSQSRGKSRTNGRGCEKGKGQGSLHPGFGALLGGEGGKGWVITEDTVQFLTSVLKEH